MEGGSYRKPAPESEPNDAGSLLSKDGSHAEVREPPQTTREEASAEGPAKPAAPRWARITPLVALLPSERATAPR